MKQSSIFAVIAVILLAPSIAYSRVPGQFKPESTSAPDLIFPLKPEKFNRQDLGNRIFLPTTIQNGNKVPAMILLPTCVGHIRSQENQLKMWTKYFVDNGYLVLVVDHLTPRRSGNICSNAAREREPAKLGRLVKDLYDAVEHLTKIPEVEKTRIFSLGFSLGGMTGGLAASQSVYEEVANGRFRPRAVGSAYGGCQYVITNFLPADASIPVLWLMGTEDTEAPPSDCQASLKAIKERIPESQHHLYEKATHSWDNKDTHGFSKVAGNGNRVTYYYDEGTTKDSMKRALEFFNSFK
jgi:dienelactone hydrolase